MMYDSAADSGAKKRPRRTMVRFIARLALRDETNRHRRSVLLFSNHSQIWWGRSSD